MTGGHPRVVLLFLDGVGLGKRDPRHNPFFSASLPTLMHLWGGSVPTIRDNRRSTALASLVQVNATLGVPGLPQSGTGQTALLTGVNAPRLIGKHFGPHPYSSLRPLLAEHNLFRRIIRKGGRACYANAFPAQYFRHIEAHPTRVTAMTMSWLSTGGQLNDARALEEGRAISADITNERWNTLGYPHMPVIAAEEAGRRLARLAAENSFVLYEYFFTDHAGHSQSMDEARRILESIDRLLAGFLDSVDIRSTLLLLTSDHGNLEDLSTRSHTRNPVPLLAVGAGHRRVAETVRSLTHIAPAVVGALH